MRFRSAEVALRWRRSALLVLEYNVAEVLLQAVFDGALRCAWRRAVLSKDAGRIQSHFVQVLDGADVPADFRAQSRSTL